VNTNHILNWFVIVEPVLVGEEGSREGVDVVVVVVV
jgi:hypothetical protein